MSGDSLGLAALDGADERDELRLERGEQLLHEATSLGAGSLAALALLSLTAVALLAAFAVTAVTLRFKR